MPNGALNEVTKRSKIPINGLDAEQYEAGSVGGSDGRMNENTEREETGARAEEERDSDLQDTLDEMRRNDVTARVKAMDIDAMTEEDARRAAIPLMEDFLDNSRDWARGSLIMTLLFGLICAVLFEDVPVDGDMACINYWTTKRALKKFRADTYKKSYKEFLRDWQNRVLKAEETEAKQADAKELQARKTAERARVRAEKAEAKARRKAEKRRPW